MKISNRLWVEETGAILSAEIMLVMSVLVIGVVAGLASVRDSVTTELADVGQALANVNQSYSFGGIFGHHTFNGGGVFIDNFDFCDTLVLNTFQNSKCVSICTIGATPVGTDGTFNNGYGGGFGGWGW